VQSTTASLAQSLEDAVPILDSLDRLVRNDLPATITATQTSLASAQTSAKLIDDVLGAITQLPLLPLDQYAPEIPLHVALGQVSESLDPLPASFENIADSLETARGNLSELQVQVKGVNAELDEINANLASATSAITQYRAITHELQVKIDAAQTKLSSSLNRISWTVTAILCWLIIASLGLLTQGLEFFGVQIH
jgi:methyl-accepting chemotaxis protein